MYGFFKQYEKKRDVDEKVEDMMRESAQQDEELYQRYLDTHRASFSTTPTVEQRMTPDEVNNKVEAMMQERARQDDEMYQRYLARTDSLPDPVIERRMAPGEVDEKLAAMMRERNQQDAEFPEFHANHQTHPASSRSVKEEPINPDDFNEKAAKMYDRRAASRNRNGRR